MAVGVHGKVQSLFNPSNSDGRDIRLDVSPLFLIVEIPDLHSFSILYIALSDTLLVIIPRNFPFHNFESEEDISVLLDGQSRNPPAK